jgi:hypothetical protein
MLDPNDFERSLKRMAWTGAAIMAALLVGVFLIGWGLT